MTSKLKISPGLVDILTRKPKKLAIKALLNQKLANRIKNKILLNIKKNRILPSGSKVKPLPQSTIDRRKELSKFNKTGRFFRSGFSNLTFTGQFLNSFKSKIIPKRKNVIFDMGPEGDHKPYKLTKNHTSFKDNTLTNAKLGQHLIDGGRDYTVIGDTVKKQITKSMKAAILKEFKLNLKRK